MAHHTDTMIYEYMPLTRPRCTRLIRLYGASDPSAPLVLKLVEISLDKTTPSYDALSYTWGGQPPNRPVSCDAKTLLITANAEAALHRLRRKRRPRHLWVDAICINQASVPERNVQVANMGDIYRRAKNVLVWLGEATPEVEDAFCIMADLWRRIKHPANLRFNNGFFTMQCELAELSTGQKSKLLRGLHDIESRPYWVRVWTLQEVALCRDIVGGCQIFCGPLEPLEFWLLDAIVHAFPVLEIPGIGPDLGTPFRMHMELAAREGSLRRGKLRSEPKEPKRNKRQLPWPKELLPGRVFNPVLVGVLAKMAHKKATDPRDYIYGLRDLFPDGLRPIPVSYERPTAEIYRDVAHHLIESHCKGSSMDEVLVLAAPSGRKAVAECPSWVPDWSSLTVLNARQMMYTYYDETYSACLRSPPIFFFRPPSILTLIGREVTTVGDVISDKFPPALEPNDLDDSADHSERQQSFGRHVALYPDDETYMSERAARRDFARRNGRQMLSILQQFIIRSEVEQLPHAQEQIAHLLSRNYDRYSPECGHTHAHPRELAEKQKWIPQVREQGCNVYADFVVGDGSVAKDKLWLMPQLRLASVLNGQELFWTADGRPGLGLDIEPGDVITVLAGCHSAVVLRRVAGNRYRLVGLVIVLCLVC